MGFRLARPESAFSHQPTGKQSKRVEDKNACQIDGCAKPIKSKGMCSMHAERARKHGDPHHKVSPAHDLSGQTFGWLTAVEKGERSPAGAIRWVCKCRCGNLALVAASNLKSAHVRSCGCLYREQPNRRTHGKTKTPAYKSWAAMLNRCRNENYREYHLYGGRGIRVCDRWSDSFETFLADMGPRPDGTSLDRYPDVDGNYEPGNCRWATPEQQGEARRDVRDGIAKKARDAGLEPVTVYARLRRGISLEAALAMPVRPENRRKR